MVGSVAGQGGIGKARPARLPIPSHPPLSWVESTSSALVWFPCPLIGWSLGDRTSSTFWYLTLIILLGP